MLSTLSRCDRTDINRLILDPTGAVQPGSRQEHRGHKRLGCEVVVASTLAMYALDVATGGKRASSCSCIEGAHHSELHLYGQSVVVLREWDRSGPWHDAGM